MKQLDEFLTRLAEDVSLREGLGEGDVCITNVVNLAAKHGLKFTSEELQTQAQPLSDEEWADAARRFDGDHSDCYILFLEEAPMSKEALNAFFKKVADDEALQSKLIEFAAAQGFEFSADELSDSDLDSVAGGLLTSYSGESKTTNVSYVKDESLTSIKYDGLGDASKENLTGIKFDNLNR